MVQYIKDKTSHLRWNLPQELAGKIIPNDGDSKYSRETLNKQTSYNNLRTVLKNHLPQEKITLDLVDELYRAVRGNAISRHLDPVLKKLTGEFNTSITVSKDQVAAVREIIEEQFSSLKLLIILDLLSTIETNITGEFDTRFAQDKILFKYLSKHLKPEELQLDDMKNSLHQKLEEATTERATSDISTTDIADAIKSEVVPVSFRY